MVRYNTIINVIDNEVNKSHQKLLLKPKTIQAFNEFHSYSCGKEPLTQEHGRVTTINGDILYDLPIDDNEKLYTDRLNLRWDKIKENFDKTGEPVNITHNHPPRKKREVIVAECLSEQDLITPLKQYEHQNQEGETVIDFPIKSISCESVNGSRMTLTRGDHFKVEDTKQVIATSFKLTKYWRSYTRTYTRRVNKIIREEFKKCEGNLEKFDFVKVQKQAQTKVLGEMGVFEENNEFKEIQREFRKHNCKLQYTHPFPYNTSQVVTI